MKKAKWMRVVAYYVVLAAMVLAPMLLREARGDALNPLYYYFSGEKAEWARKVFGEHCEATKNGGDANTYCRIREGDDGLNFKDGKAFWDSTPVKDGWSTVTVKDVDDHFSGRRHAITGELPATGRLAEAAKKEGEIVAAKAEAKAAREKPRFADRAPTDTAALKKKLDEKFDKLKVAMATDGNCKLLQENDTRDSLAEDKLSSLTIPPSEEVVLTGKQLDSLTAGLKEPVAPASGASRRDRSRYNKDKKAYDEQKKLLDTCNKQFEEAPDVQTAAEKQGEDETTKNANIQECKWSDENGKRGAEHVPPAYSAQVSTCQKDSKPQDICIGVITCKVHVNEGIRFESGETANDIDYTAEVGCLVEHKTPADCNVDAKVCAQGSGVFTESTKLSEIKGRRVKASRSLAPTSAAP